jgi:hypothetical protein
MLRYHFIPRAVPYIYKIYGSQATVSAVYHIWCFLTKNTVYRIPYILPYQYPTIGAVLTGFRTEFLYMSFHVQKLVPFFCTELKYKTHRKLGGVLTDANVHLSFLRLSFELYSYCLACIENIMGVTMISLMMRMI